MRSNELLMPSCRETLALFSLFSRQLTELAPEVLFMLSLLIFEAMLA
jgi:hypothetical protein